MRQFVFQIIVFFLQNYHNFFPQIRQIQTFTPLVYNRFANIKSLVGWNRPSRVILNQLTIRSRSLIRLLIFPPSFRQFHWEGIGQLNVRKLLHTMDKYQMTSRRGEKNSEANLQIPWARTFA